MIHFGPIALWIKLLGGPVYLIALTQVAIGDGGAIVSIILTNLHNLYYTPIPLVLILAYYMVMFTRTLVLHKYDCTFDPKRIEGDKRPDYMLNQELKHHDDLRFRVVYRKMFCGWSIYSHEFYISGEFYSQMQGVRLLNAFDNYEGACRRLEAYAKNLGTVNFDRYDNQDPFKLQMTVGLAGALSNELREKLHKAGFPGARPL
mgnify:FL=1